VLVVAVVVTAVEIVDVVVVVVIADVVVVAVVDVEVAGDVVVDLPQDAKTIDITIRQVSSNQRIPFFTYTSNII
jgi:hypothetical protein